MDPRRPRHPRNRSLRGSCDLAHLRYLPPASGEFLGSSWGVLALRGPSDLRLPGSPDDLRWSFTSWAIQNTQGEFLTFFCTQTQAVEAVVVWIGMACAKTASMRQPSIYTPETDLEFFLLFYNMFYLGWVLVKIWVVVRCTEKYEIPVSTSSGQMPVMLAGYLAFSCVLDNQLRSAGLKPSVTGRRQNDPTSWMVSSDLTGDGFRVYGGHINHSLTWSGHSRILLAY